MATKTSTQVKQELDDLLYESTADAAPWTAAIKQRAINRAIRGAFPNFKQLQIDTTHITLVANTYRYSLASLTDMEDFGNYAVVQVRLQPATTDTSTDWTLLRRCTQENAGGTWYLHVPEEIANSYAAQKLAIYYYSRIAELTFSGSDTIDVQFVNYVVYAAAADLIRRFIQGGSDFNVTPIYPQLLTDYQQRADKELIRNTVVAMTCYVMPRAEE